MSTPVIAVFDVGRTNKKVFLFDEAYHIQYENETHLKEIKDEDGFPCQDVHALATWIRESITTLFALAQFEIKAIAISAHGASFVNIDKQGNPVTPLYDYLKPFPESLRQKFYSDYGEDLPRITASPSLGSLNSALQLYRLKQEQPEVFQKIHYALHLPQYISFLISGQASSDITSIGCHTHLWDFEKKGYHDWVSKEGLISKLAPIHTTDTVHTIIIHGKQIRVGIGLHDSSAALIPYLKTVTAPFVLISTGTWCISLNPFNPSPLTRDELGKDSLCYLSYDGKPVKAARLFAGHEHEEQAKRIAAHFGKEAEQYKTVSYRQALVSKLKQKNPVTTKEFHGGIEPSVFVQRDLDTFASYEEAYYQLLIDIIQQQYFSTSLVLNNTNVKRIFVDGGFSKNPLYMNLMADAFPHLSISGASVAQASALGAALVIHHHWNSAPVPGHLIDLHSYPTAK